MKKKGGGFFILKIGGQVARKGCRGFRRPGQNSTENCNALRGSSYLLPPYTCQSCIQVYDAAPSCKYTVQSFTKCDAQTYLNFLSSNQGQKWSNISLSNTTPNSQISTILIRWEWCVPTSDRQVYTCTLLQDRPRCNNHNVIGYYYSWPVLIQITHNKVGLSL